MRSVLVLARWLGPWASPSRAPQVATREDELAGPAGGLRVRLYEPKRAARRTYLIAPGLHYAAADDPRLDRFCRVLCAAGHLVIAPFIPGYLALTPNARAIEDFIRVADALPRWSPQPPTVFSISFGSLLAFALAAERPGLAERLVIFGGYADFSETLAFALSGQVASGRQAARDPLNQPVVLLNLLDAIPHDRGERAALEAGWRRYVERVWGRTEMKLDGRFQAVAAELAVDVPASVRELFLIGIGALPGAWPLARAALPHVDLRALDPGPHLARVRGRVELVHGADDDVIPFEHAHLLAQRLPNAEPRVHVTGLYGHTGASFGKLLALPKELATMIRVLRLLA
ncbi:MAG: alpha/beta hydrolase [Kofleriaceae bacterium]